MGLHVSTLTESSSGPQDADPCNNVYLLQCGIPNAYKIYIVVCGGVVKACDASMLPTNHRT